MELCATLYMLNVRMCTICTAFQLSQLTFPPLPELVKQLKDLKEKLFLLLLFLKKHGKNCSIMKNSRVICLSVYVHLGKVRGGINVAWQFGNIIIESEGFLLLIKKTFKRETKRESQRTRE